MPDRSESESRKLLRRLRDTLAEPGLGQERLDRITGLIAESMQTDVCSIYLFRDRDTLEQTRVRVEDLAAFIGPKVDMANLLAAAQ